MFEDIIGHKKQLELLASALVKGKLAHAYVFAGPEGVGKRTIAKKLAYALLNPNPSPLTPLPEGEGKFHPDLLVVERREDKKEIIIEQIRELVYKLALKPYQAKYKIAVIDNAEQMNEEAANALLKSLEEPKDYTYLFLVTSNPNRLPKTILSRCQKITFGPVDLPVVKSQAIDAAEQFYSIFINGRLSDKLISAYDLADLETEEIKDVLDHWLKLLQQALQASASKPLAHKISQVMTSRKYLEQNVNCKLLLTNLMLNS